MDRNLENSREEETQEREKERQRLRGVRVAGFRWGCYESGRPEYFQWGMTPCVAGFVTVATAWNTHYRYF